MAVASSVSAFGRGIGFVKEVVIAASFGLSAAVDVYLVAAVFIAIPVSVVVNAVQPAFITAVAANSGRNARELLATTSTLTVTCLLAILPLWLLLLPHLFPILAAGFSPEKQDELRTALFWLIPYYFLNATSTLCYGLLQAQGRYVLNGLVPIATPILTIALVLLFDDMRDWRVLAMSLVLGMSIETIVLMVMLFRGGERLSLRASFASLRGVWTQAVALIPGTVMVAVVPMVEQAIAASLGEGTNAALSYGYKLPSSLASISATAIGITTLPYFASQVARGEFKYCLHSLDTVGRWLFASGVIFVVLLVPLSEEIVGVLYGRGEFDMAAVQRVAPVQSAYFLQVPFAVIAILSLKTLSALGRNDAVSYLTAGVLTLQCVLGWLLGSHLGASGIAWAAAAGSATLATAGFVYSRRLLVKFSHA